jgi:hypothetical protein
MMLRPKAYMRPFDHPLWANAWSMGTPEAKELLAAARKGDKAARDRVIRGYLKLGLHIVGQYLAVCSARHMEDLVSAASDGIMFGVCKLIALPEPPARRNFPHAYIDRAIRYEIDKMLSERTPKLVKPEYFDFISKSKDTGLTDAVNSIVETPFEEQLIELLASGTTKQDAALQLNVSVSTLSKALDTLKARFEKEFDHDRDEE